MFDLYDILLEEFGVTRGLYSFINDIHKQITDTRMKSVEYTSSQLKDDFGINFNGTIMVTVDEGEHSDDCSCTMNGGGCSITIGKDVIQRKSAYEKIAHELTHFMKDHTHKLHNNESNWAAGERAGEGTPEQEAAFIIELYKRNELEAKLNEMYYRCIKNPKLICEIIKEAAEFGNGNVKLMYNAKKPDDQTCILNAIFEQLEETIHLKQMNNYYNIVANTPDNNTKSVIPLMVSWSNQRNFPFKFTSPNPKKAKTELMDQMSAIYNEYLESLINVAKSLVKEFVKAFFNKGQQNNSKNQQQKNVDYGENGNTQGADYVPESKVRKTFEEIIEEDIKKRNMKAIVLKFVNKLEGYKTAVKNLHWNSKNMSQHKLFDDVAESLADFQDKVSEVEQSMSGRLPMNKLSGTKYTISSPQQMLKDLFNDVMAFYKGLERLGDDYIGMRSDCESYLSDIQRQQYLLDFTLKEELRRRLRNAING